VIDCDGGYNDALSVAGDTNHPDAESSRRWIAVCDSLADKIVQPTLHPRRPNVRPFFFHAYDPAWEQPLVWTVDGRPWTVDSGRWTAGGGRPAAERGPRSTVYRPRSTVPAGKPYAMVYVGNNWFRWRPLQRVLAAIEPVRDQVGRIKIVGHGWDRPAPWANPSLVEDAYRHDPAYLDRLGVEVEPPVRFDRVIHEMGQGVFSPVIYRPLFDELRLVTCRSYETPAAGTLPLFCQDPAFVAEIYGDAALELVLPDRQPAQKILDLLRRPAYYARIVHAIRAHLAAHHSYQVRLAELIEIAHM